MKTYSLHKIIDKNDIPFEPTDYSKFKFGNKSISRKFGTDLAKGFISDVLKNNLIENPIVVCSSPYFFIPTATYAMKDYFVRELNSYLVSLGMEAVEELKIHRNTTYTEDYGAMSAEERKNLINKDSFYMDANFVKDKIVLFLDDIKITGAHEEAIKKTITQHNVASKDVYFLYFAELINPKEDPKIENFLNYAFVKSLQDIKKVFKKEYILNTRVVKYILNSPQKEFNSFISSQPQAVVSTLYHLAIGNRYYKIKEYQTNLKTLKTMI